VPGRLRSGLGSSRAPACGVRLLRPHRDHTSTTSSCTTPGTKSMVRSKPRGPDLLNLSARKDIWALRQAVASFTPMFGGTILLALGCLMKSGIAVALAPCPRVMRRAPFQAPQPSQKAPHPRVFSSERNEGRPRETALAEERNDALRPGAAPSLLRRPDFSSLGIGFPSRQCPLRINSSCGSGNDRQHARRRLSGDREVAACFFRFATLWLAGRIRLVA
jgi:hypothetical protein